MKTIVKEVEKVIKEKVSVNYLEFSDFEEFLMLNGAASKYAKNIILKNDTIDIKSFVLRQKTNSVFSRAFNWGDTDEGYDYWSDIAILWDSYIRNHNYSYEWYENNK